MISFILISLVASVGQDAPANSKPVISSDLQAKFDDFLKDPDAAQIRITSDESVSEAGSSEHVICGRYNAKNSYGGYVGFKDFVYLSSIRTLYSDGTAVRPGGTESLEEIMTHHPDTIAEIDSLSAKGNALISEVRNAFSLCTDNQNAN